MSHVRFLIQHNHLERVSMMSRTTRDFAFLGLAWIATSVANGQTSYPMITRVEPTAVQRGKSAELTISGVGDFTGATALLVEGDGIITDIVTMAKPEPAKPTTKAMKRAVPGGEAKAKVTVSATASPTIRELRVVAPTGVSSIGLVVLSDDPVVTETHEKGNNTRKGAQYLTLPVTVSGKIGVVEDVDWFKFEAKAGQVVTFSLWGNRLENKIHDLQTHLDPILILHDAKGREVATDDNHDYADPLLIHTFKDDGIYYLQLRDTNYAGNANWTYVLQATTAPFLTSVFPNAVNPGKISEMEGRGANFDRTKPIKVEVPANLTDGPNWFAFQTDRGTTSAYPLLVTNLPIIRENVDSGETSSNAQVIKLPAAISGRLGDPNDIDAYRFDAKKGQMYVFEVVARRIKSSIDPLLRILDAKGVTVMEVDDTPGLGKDLRAEWTAPADGSYAIQIGDLHSRGGQEFGYAILAEPAKPDFVATCDPDKINLGPGSRTPIFVKVVRRGGLSQPISASFAKLPSGVTASPFTIPVGMTQGEIVLTATKDAKPTGTFLTLLAKAESGPDKIVHAVAPFQEIYMPGGGRGVYPVTTLALAITKPSDILVDAKQKEITLKAGESATIDVVVTRQGDYAQGVNLAIDLAHLGQVYASPLPTGVTLKDAGSKTLLGPKETAGKVVLMAAADAPACERVPIAIMGHVSINFVVKTAYSSAPIYVSIVPKDKKAPAKKP
jgi:hypothetical protein